MTDGFPHNKSVMRKAFPYNNFIMKNHRTVSIDICHFTSIGIPIIKIRRSHNRLSFVKGIPIQVRWYLFIESAFFCSHYSDVIIGAIASQITSPTIVYSTVYSDTDQRKHQSSASLAFVWGIHWGPANSPHKWPVTLKMFPFDDVIMTYWTAPLRSAGMGCHHCIRTVPGETSQCRPSWLQTKHGVN